MAFVLLILVTPSMTLLPDLIEAIADAQDMNPEELEFVLEDHISTEAIQRLDGYKNDSWGLQFELLNHTVDIKGDGTILVVETKKRAFD